MPIIEFLTSVDLGVLHYFNVDLAHPWADQFWLAITRLHKFRVVQFGVVPLLLAWAYTTCRHEIWKPVVMVGVTILLTDGLCYRVIKARVDRPRPFANPAIASWLRPIGKAQGASFPSNHAANSFAAAGILGWYFTRGRRWFYLLATLVALSRVCLGVHYPSDVLAGVLIGSSVAFFVTTNVISHRRELYFSQDDAPETSRIRRTY